MATTVPSAKPIANISINSKAQSPNTLSAQTPSPATPIITKPQSKPRHPQSPKPLIIIQEVKQIQKRSSNRAIIRSYRKSP